MAYDTQGRILRRSAGPSPRPTCLYMLTSMMVDFGTGTCRGVPPRSIPPSRCGGGRHQKPPLALGRERLGGGGHMRESQENVQHLGGVRRLRKAERREWGRGRSARALQIRRGGCARRRQYGGGMKGGASRRLGGGGGMGCGRGAGRTPSTPAWPPDSCRAVITWVASANPLKSDTALKKKKKRSTYDPSEKAKSDKATRCTSEDIYTM